MKKQLQEEVEWRVGKTTAPIKGVAVKFHCHDGSEGWLKVSAKNGILYAEIACDDTEGNSGEDDHYWRNSAEFIYTMINSNLCFDDKGHGTALVDSILIEPGSIEND